MLSNPLSLEEKKFTLDRNTIDNEYHDLIKIFNTGKSKKLF